MPTQSSKTTTNHAQIQRWATARDARPARVKGTGSNGDPGMIRLDFPGYSGRGKLEPISWNEWFEAFDDNDLALVYQEKTAGGQRSNFNKLVGRSTAVARKRGDSGASRQARPTRKRAGSSRSAGRKTTGRSRGRTAARSRTKRSDGRRG